jgi:hypothetical protein
VGKPLSPALEGAPAVIPACGNCGYFVPPHAIDRTHVSRSGIEPTGFCQRYPQTLPKKPDQYCGEHSPISEE